MWRWRKVFGLRSEKEAGQSGLVPSPISWNNKIKKGKTDIDRLERQKIRENKEHEKWKR